MTLFLRSDEVKDLASPAEYIDEVRSAFRQHGAGGVASGRESLRMEGGEGQLFVYMAVLPEDGVMGPGYVMAKGYDEPDIWMVTPVFDMATGEPLAIVDGASINPHKTAAASAVATDHLAREDSAVAGIIGSGVQARSQLLYLSEVRELREAKVYSPTEANREQFAVEMDGEVPAEVVPVESSAQAVQGSDIVVTATTAGEPVFDGADLEAGTHVVAMGQYDSSKREVDATTLRRSKYVIDLEERAPVNAGAYIVAREEGAIPDDHIHAELGDVVAGNVPGRTSEEEITLFDSAGTAIETVAAGHLVYRKTKQGGGGTPIEFESWQDGLARWTPRR